MGTNNGSAAVSINAPANRSASPQASHTANRAGTNHRTSGDVSMDGKTNPAKAQHTEIAKVLHNERNGLTEIQSDARQGLWANAWKTASVLDSDFNRAVLPSLKATKGNTYAEAIHSKLDALRDAVESHNRSETDKLVQVNRANLHAVAKIFGVSMPK